LVDTKTSLMERQSIVIHYFWPKIYVNFS